MSCKYLRKRYQTLVSSLGLHNHLDDEMSEISSQRRCTEFDTDDAQSGKPLNCAVRVKAVAGSVEAAETGPTEDLATAFRMAPVGLLVSRQRVIVSCNQSFSNTFGYSPSELAGRSLECLYPSHSEFEHVGERAHSVMRRSGLYSDERIMRKGSGSLFWCHVSGRSTDINDPFFTAIWAFEDISAVRQITADLTAREREIAQLLVTGKSSKLIARELEISPRTVEAHRVRLMRKYGVTTAGELIGRLIGRH